jgi:hypothetical protein
MRASSAAAMKEMTLFETPAAQSMIRTSALDRAASSAINSRRSSSDRLAIF